MLEPISYFQVDTHYDFFAQYTKEDQSLLQEFYESAKSDIDDILEISETNEIGMKEVATSQTAIEELPNSFQDIRKAQNRKKDETERE